MITALFLCGLALGILIPMDIIENWDEIKRKVD